MCWAETIRINRIPAAIVGVTPQGFDGAMQAGESPDVSVPLAHYLRFQPDRAARAQPWYWWVRIMGRLAPGATRTQAAASLEPIFQEAAREGWLAGRSPDSPAGEQIPDTPTLAADPGAQGENDVRRQYREAAPDADGPRRAGAGCGVRQRCEPAARARRRPPRARSPCALRSAQAAAASSGSSSPSQCSSRSRGAALGIALAWWGRDLLLALRPFGNASVVLDLPLDARVLGFTVAVTMATALLFGLAPALRATRVNLTAQFQSGTRTIGGGGRSRLRQALMVVQIALSLCCSWSAPAFSCGRWATCRTWTPASTAAASSSFASTPRPRATPASTTPGLQARMQESLERLPGVRAATFSSVALLSRTRQNKTDYRARAGAAPRRVDDRQHQRAGAEFLHRHGAAAGARPWIHGAR